MNMKLYFSISKNYKTIISMVFFLVLISITFTITLTLILQQRNLLGIINNSNLDECYYYSCMSQDITQKNNGNSIKYCYSYQEEFAANMLLLNYNRDLISKISLPLSKGEWFSEDEQAQIILPYEYRYKYKPGEKIILHVPSNLGNEIYTEAEIKGFLTMSNNYINFNYSGDVQLSSLIQSGKDVIIIANATTEFVANLDDNNGCLLQNLTHKDIEECNKTGIIVALDKLKDEYIADTTSTLYQQVAIEIVLFILSVSGLGAMNFLSFYRKKREYGIFFLCGTNQTTIFKFCLFDNLIIMMISLILYTIIQWSFYDQTILLYLHNMIWILALMFIIFFISFSPFWLVIRGESIRQLITDNE